jgi:hypothetical protein
MASIIKNYRPYSYSENDIVVNRELYYPLQPIESPKLIVEVESKKKCLTKYFFKRILMFIIHLSLIGLFEIIFFFNVIVNYLDNSLKNLTNNFVEPINNDCINYNFTEKMYVTYFFNLFVNISNVDNESTTSYQERYLQNRDLITKAWIYFIILVLISFIMIAINYLKKCNVKLTKICIDNLIMIVLLGCYEYLFLKTIIFKYMLISNIELVKNMLEQLNNCLI